MLQATYTKYILDFKVPSATSRSVLTQKISYFIKVIDEKYPDIIAIGEAAPLDGLSIDAHPSFEFFLKNICDNINEFINQIATIRLKYPSIAFALECISLQLYNKSTTILFNTDFSKGIQSIPINGLIWIGSIDSMKIQINEKIAQGYKVVKLKIGANNFDDELNILKWIRTEYRNEELILRLDANGAFALSDAEEKIKQLSEFDIHSIEQPIKQGQHEYMATLCQRTSIPIALDEELITIVSKKLKNELIEKIKPQYIILKPTLHGGIEGSQEWIDIARKNKIPYWITSALESNIGLNAIAQWTSSIEDARDITHGLGTGQLYTNNIDSPLFINNGHLFFNTNKSIDISSI